MADFNNPSLTSTYSDLASDIKARDEDIAKWFDGTTSTNLPSGVKRWNSASNSFEEYNGSTWTSLTTEYSINVSSVNNCTVNDLGITIFDLWSASKIINYTTNAIGASSILDKLKSVDGSGSGLDSDFLDGKDSTYFQNTQIVEW